MRIAAERVKGHYVRMVEVDNALDRCWPVNNLRLALSGDKTPSDHDLVATELTARGYVARSTPNGVLIVSGP